MSQQMWSHSVNEAISIDVTSQVASAAKKSSGDLQADVLRLASENSVVLCPAIRLSEADGAYVVQCRNVQVDLASWSIMLIAIAAQKRWVELCVFNCELSAQHLQTLGEVVALGNVCKLSLEFCSGVSDEDWVAAVPSLLGGGSMLQHLSLQGNRSSDTVAGAIAAALTTNLQLKSLNMCRNAFSDDGASTLLQALKFNNSIKAISLADNDAGDACCAITQMLISGFEVRADDESLLAASMDRIKAWNKELKATNKKRGKDGLGELSELPQLAEPFIEDGVKRLQNTALECIDLSGNRRISIVGLDALRSLHRPSHSVALVLRDVPSADVVLHSHEQEELITVYI